MRDVVRFAVLVLALTSSIALTSCVSPTGPHQQPASELVDALESERVDADALALCIDRSPADYVAAYSTSPSAIRALVRAGQEKAAGLDRLPGDDGSTSVICVQRQEDEAGRQIVIASWIAWDSAGNSPAGFLEIFCDESEGYALAKECLAD